MEVLLLLYFFICLIVYFLSKKALLAHEIASNLLPELHIKTHFQAAISISNSLPGKKKLEIQIYYSKLYIFYLNLFFKFERHLKIIYF